MTAPSNFKFSLQCGVGGTWVEVTSDVLFEEGPITFTDGRTSQFDGFNPGTFPLTLNNGTGKYTPNSGTTSLAVPLSEGMGVCMQLGNLLLAGTIRTVALIFPPKEFASKARVRITVDDMLGNAARHTISDLVTGLIGAATPYLYWPLNDPAGSVFAAEYFGGAPLQIIPPVPTVTFGVPPAKGFTSTQMLLGDGTNTGGVSAGSSGATTTVIAAPDYPAGSLGWWTGVFTPDDATLGSRLLSVYFGGFDAWFQFIAAGGADIGKVRLFCKTYNNVTPVVTTSASVWLTPATAIVWEVGLSTTFSSGVWSVTASAYVNGTLAVTATFDTISRGISYVDMLSTAPARFSNLVHTRDRISGFTSLMAGTESAAITAIAATTPEITLDTLPTLSSVVVIPDFSGTTLEGLTTVVRGEQGYMWVETSGTLTAPVPKVKIVARNRERAIDYTFDVSEILDPIAFIHSLTNTVSQATAEGPTNSATYRDTSLVPLVGSASSSDNVLFRDYNDLYGYASDRVVRGVNRGITIQQITVDATSTQINRWSDLTAIRPGHRIHITGLPSTQLGYSTWDGFVVGRQIDNTQDSQTDEPKSLFTFSLSPWSKVYVYDDATSVYDTATYAY